MEPCITCLREPEVSSVEGTVVIDGFHYCEKHAKLAKGSGPTVVEPEPEMVNHPNHYGGGDNVYEVIKVLSAWGLDFCLGNTVKYIARAGKKDPSKEIEDLEKAAFYLNYKINLMKDGK